MNTSSRACSSCFLLSVLPAARLQPQRLPNFIIVYADDMGYADIGTFSTIKGASRPHTPNLDRMAAEGIRLTNFYVAQAVCSASRAALLTGAYSNRVGILRRAEPHGAARHQPGRDDDRRSPEAARLRHRDLWQVASRTPEAVSATRITASTNTTVSRIRTTCGHATRSRRTSIPTCRSSKATKSSSWIPISRS